MALGQSAASNADWGGGQARGHGGARHENTETPMHDRMKTGQVKPDGCRGVAGFTEEDWRKLDAIKLN
jgi:hypothetical protein